MRDFCLSTLAELLKAFQKSQYQFVRLDQYWQNKETLNQENKIILFRHDVDRFPKTALATAKLEAGMGIYGTYFFRTKPWVFQEDIINKIHSLGHEIGYHYEVLADARGDYDEAAKRCRDDLSKLRGIAPVVSAAMHSRPLSRWDNRLFWQRYALNDFDLQGEAYLSVDHNHYMYLADSGRNWNANRTVVWDSVEGTAPPAIKNGTQGFIALVAKKSITNIQLLIHPNRWPSSAMGWYLQLIADHGINCAKQCVNFARR